MASPKRRSGLFVLRSLYLATVFRPVNGVEEMPKPQRRLVDPLSMMMGICASRWLSYFSAIGTEIGK